MSEPISNLSFDWAVGMGIQLSFDAAADAGNESRYLMSVLVDESWAQFGVLGPVAYSTPGTGRLSISPPRNFYAYPWSSVLSLAGGSDTAPNSIAFQIIHLDQYGSYSEPVSVVAMPPRARPPYGAQHLPNFISVTAAGGFLTFAQDSFDEIASSVEMIVGTVEGSRTGAPSYGVPEIPLAPIDAGNIKNIIEQWEPRAQVDVQIRYDDAGEASMDITVKTQTGGS